MNKKVDLTRIKKLPTVRVGHFSSKAPTKMEGSEVLDKTFLKHVFLKLFMMEKHYFFAHLSKTVPQMD